MLDAFERWSLLGVLPSAQEKLTDEPAYVLEAFSILARVKRELDQRDEVKAKEAELKVLAEMIRGGR